MHGDWKMTTYCSFAAVAGRKIFWVLWLHFKSCHFYIHVTVFTWIDAYKNIFGVFRVLSFFSSLTDLLCVFFPTIWLSACGQIDCHTLAARAQAQLWKWPFSHLRGTDAELRVYTSVDSRFKLPKNVNCYFTRKYGGTAWTGRWFEQDYEAPALPLEHRMFFTTPLVKKVRSGCADKNQTGGIISPGEGHA